MAFGILVGYLVIDTTMAQPSALGYDTHIVFEQVFFSSN
jgi:hypothetical protein